MPIFSRGRVYETASGYPYSPLGGGAARTLLSTPENTLYFSPVSIWEIVIKLGIGREDFRVDPERFLKLLVQNGYGEQPVRAEHALLVATLPPLHKDPFDRLLLAQARSDGMALLTADTALAQYGEPVMAV